MVLNSAEIFPCAPSGEEHLPDHRIRFVERVRAGMRRARLEGQHIGRQPLVLDSAAIQQDRQRGQSLREIARGHRISTATVQRVLRKHAPTTQEHAA